MMNMKTFIIYMFVILFSTVIAQNSNRHKFHVGVILDLNTTVGKMAQTSIAMAIEDFYAVHSNYNTSLVLHTRNAQEDDVEATYAALDLLQNTKTKVIIGPQKSTQAVMVSQIGNKSQVPIISFSATSPTLSSMNVPYLVRTGINDTAQLTTITSLIKAYGWREVVPICDDNDFGWGILPYLDDRLQEIDVRIPYRSLIPISSTENEVQIELLKLKTMQTRVFIVHMSSSRGSILFLNAKKLGMSEGYVWIMTTGVTNMINYFDPSVISAMRGALGVRLYVPKTAELNDFTTRWRKRIQGDYPQENYNEPSIYALWAYDTIYALAMAVENAGFTNSRNGTLLLKALSNITFQGLSGNFELVNGQLQYIAFEIINVVGQGIREIGYWRQKQGFSKQVDASSDKNYSTSSNDLYPVIWQGESIVIPKGWEIPVSGTKLRVGVIKSSYTEFIKVERDPVRNTIIPSGYAVDVFEEAIKKLPYAVPHEYELFDLSQGVSVSYNDFVYQVYLGRYDVAIGDITVRYNRTNYVDFSLSYTDSGVAMIVPVKQATRNTFFFLQPISFGLWATSAMFLIASGIIIWLMEYELFKERHEDSKQEHLGAIFHLSIFAYQEQELKHIQSRIVAIFSAFLLLVLTSSYIAGLTSMLTVQQLQPTVTDVHDLIRNGNYVGYGKGSFVEGLLLQLGFDKSKIRGYDVDKFGEALDDRSVTVVVDEVPYIKSFLAKHCNSYMMVPIYKTAGFGFAFQKGSPLVSDMSKAILNITDGDEIIKISKKWIDGQNCQDDNSIQPSSNNFNVLSFWRLFVVIGVVFMICPILFVLQKKLCKTVRTNSLSKENELYSLARERLMIETEKLEKERQEYKEQMEAKENELATLRGENIMKRRGSFGSF